MKAKLNTELVIKELKEVYGENLLAVYLRGSSLYNLRTETSDLDIFAIVRAKKKDLLKKTNHSPQLKLYNDEFDIVVLDEYKLIEHVRRGILNTLENFYADPIYVSPLYKETAEYLKANATNLIMGNLVSLVGSLSGYYMSHVKHFESNSMTLGNTVEGKHMAMAKRSKVIVEELLAYKGDGNGLERTILSEDEPFRVLLTTLKGTKVVEPGNREALLALRDELVAFAPLLIEYRKNVKDYFKEKETPEYMEHLIELLLPPV